MSINKNINPQVRGDTAMNLGQIRAVASRQPYLGGCWVTSTRKNLRCAAGTDGLSYKSAGVDIEAGNELVRRIQKLNPNIGGFSGMVPFGEFVVSRWSCLLVSLLMMLCQLFTM